MPIVAERHEPLPSVEEDPGITGGNAWSRGAGRPGTTTEINGISIPGQRRVLGRMNKAERKVVFVDNLNVRRAWLAAEGTDVQRPAETEQARRSFVHDEL
jgi:hypothetical protein